MTDLNSLKIYTMEINRQAHFSEDGKHRYWLLRSWEESPRMILLIGLNPSTANDIQDDNTVRSCIRLTQQLGYGGFIICNLYSFITRDPKILQANMADAITIATNMYLVSMIAKTHKTICAWGSWKFISDRATEVLAIINEPYCFGCNGDGTPKHPLYLNSKAELINYKK